MASSYCGGGVGGPFGGPEANGTQIRRFEMFSTAEGEGEEGEAGMPFARSVDQALLITPTPETGAGTQRGAAGGGRNWEAQSGNLRRPYLFPQNNRRPFPRPSSAIPPPVADQGGANPDWDEQQFATVDIGRSNRRTTATALHSAQNMAIRYRLFNRLDPGGTHLMMPGHVIPNTIFSILPFDEFKDTDGKQSSLVTVFSIWNTMMGTSILALPWALQQAGLLLGLALMLLMAAIAFYTAYRVVQSPSSLTLDNSSPDFPDVCRFFWGKWAEYFAVFFSVLVLIGGVILYFVLMTNFLYFTGNIVYEALQPNSSVLPIMANNTFACDVFCPEHVQGAYADDLLQFTSHWFDGGRKLLAHHSAFQDIWRLQGGVPLILAFCLFPLLNFRSPGFFMRFNVLGTIAVFYLLCFTVAKAFQCGINVDLWDPGSEHYAQLFSWKFPALSGTLALSYFIHNAILTILRNQKHPENNARDLFIGYLLSAACYLLISLLFFIAFPTFRRCISDNLLNNFASNDLLSAVARVFLFFQMLTVLPLLMYLIRVQFSYVFAGTVYPGLFYVLLINIGILTVATFFAVVYPHVGPILRYVGSISGLVYIFLLPCAVHLKRLQMQGRLGPAPIVFHSLLILCGLLNLLAQFLV